MNILAIGAHFDDVELGCGGALAKHTSSGDQVTVYVATKSGYANGLSSQLGQVQTPPPRARKPWVF